MSSTEVETLNEVKPFVISRNNMPTLTHVEKNGELFHLGQLKDFRKIDSIRRFMPNTGRSSLSWVSLNSGDELKVHEHPIESMIIITAGQAELTGDTHCIVNEGDIICVPSNTKHGFIGRGTTGFWGISIQFEERGLYEDPLKALVKFDVQESFHQKILNRQEEWKKTIASHSLFNLVHSLEDKTPFLIVLKNWSDAFQELVLLRSVMVSDAKFHQVTSEHLVEEFGHNKAFNHLVPTPPSLRMQAVCSWFNQKMLKLDDKHRLVLMNLAIEGSATVFYDNLYSLFVKTKEADHFEEHNELDHTHEGMGFDLININNENEFLGLLKTLNDTWGMISELYTVLEEDCKKLLSK
ncbi:cupin domain-containing protein [Xenorhabdus bovienii]|uniref:cupin domain-containing protein n=1 Tax=Xenorhabdus bovienii TaxID=40576 RepID=UPI00237C6F04|nr:cupin domain-containing protein [Xenorhabdus bovienii]MDE1483209.1 cupin domain-containing protein [Xenorhabdus bovienii]MDE9428802.1 cupin domain-containing protein [Xenorhabdus bovienii]MDE9441993.1 cupin domain-containing protein [Xenorhabdus bovienii]MDE9540065.1 cupin domain-containing protein [Xenorhabdus bovienii]